MIWIVIALVLLVTVVAIAIPVLNAKPPRSTSEEYDLAVFTDQMKELERDQARGLINAEEYKAARAEIGRRILAAQRIDESAPKTAAAGRGNTIAAATVLLLIPLIAAPLYVWRGNPELIGDRVVAQPVPAAQRDATQQAGLVESVTRLKARLEAAPDDVDGWVLLGRSYMVTQQPLLAIDAYSKAIALRPDDASVRSFLGEAIVFSAEGTVTETARAAFTMAIRADPKDPAARFYLGMADAQAGNVRAAFDSWLALAADTPVDAPWRPGLIQQLRAAAQELNVDLAAVLPDAAPAPVVAPPPRGPSRDDVEAAQEMSPGERQEMIRGMVAQLAARLEENPNDIEGWERLARSYRVLGESNKATEAEARVQALRGDDAAAPRGPSRDDVEAAQEMSPGERQEMIRGMVAQLAARLEENPYDTEGWERLARSYRVLGETEKATEAEARVRQLRGEDAPPPPARAAAPTAPPDNGAQQVQIEGMVAGLAARLEDDPADREGWIRLTRSYQVLEEPAKALDAFEKATTQFPNDAELLQLFARAVLQQTAPDAPISNRAFNLYRRVLEAQNENPEALYFVGLGEAQRENPGEARRLWTTLLQYLEQGSEARGVVEGRLERLKTP
jgi:cytochrome c-type biogenesis protein CcmH